ncbi:MAG: pyridoxamine 5'-phosphate oxidase family protein [Calditrichaeota bacterium]|nr:MAG: pyridoxamine 5'-phosphate oxidase family protein [Calditrichota bacterium]MBL1207893.1 pyridoxamine 5'-phosphate oxidase family protein [Calditrichota bacterium]NOG47728.1 pyridoxamine 5'-phosphate oxidase family protein [Calditrichota bacterium]
MDLVKDWKRVRLHFNKSFRSSLHVSIASVDSENNPTVTPIGSLFLNGNQTGFYFEKFPTKLSQHAKSNKNVCILGVNSGRGFWLKSLLDGKFSTYPALKLYGQMGEKRKATEKEINRLKRRMRLTKMFKGHKYLWGKKMDMVREISFSKVEIINLREMTKEL